MFSNLIFLVIAMILVSFAPMGNGNDWIASPAAALAISLGVYALLLSTIVLQNKILKKALRVYKPLIQMVASFDLIAFLAFFLFIMAGQRALPDSLFSTSFVALLFYFAGLFVFHLSSYEYLPSGTKGLVSSASDYSFRQVRLMIPFVLPYLLFSFLIDLSGWIPALGLREILTGQSTDTKGTLILFGLTGAFLLLVLLFFPPVIQAIWGCRPIRNEKLRNHLEEVCRKAGFRHAGMKTWGVMNHAYTAGIIGILPRFRYVMFTQRILHELSPEALEAILVHEIGHSYRKHLLIYPLIILGMVVSTALFSLFFSEAIDEAISLLYILYPSPLWKAAYPVAVFLPMALIVPLYFRFVFGYFSRLFERQADLHGYEVGVPFSYMQEALDRLGILTGHTHHQPNWHHHSIQERIDFLEKASQNPSLVASHHRRVRRSLSVYLVLLALATLLVAAPSIPEAPFLSPLAQFSKNASRSLSDRIAEGLHGRLAAAYIDRHQLPASPIVHNTLFQTVRDYAARYPEWALYYLSAKALLAEEEMEASAKLMSAAWDKMDPKEADEEIRDEFHLLTAQILREYHGTERNKLEGHLHESQPDRP